MIKFLEPECSLSCSQKSPTLTVSLASLIHSVPSHTSVRSFHLCLDPLKFDALHFKSTSVIYSCCKVWNTCASLNATRWLCVCGSGGMVPRISSLRTRWRWVDSFVLWPLYPRGKIRRYPLDRRLGGPQNWSECFGEETNLLNLPRIKPWYHGRPTHTWSLYWLNCSGYSGNKSSFQVKAVPVWIMLSFETGFDWSYR
jgi:hypothetical protein